MRNSHLNPSLLPATILLAAVAMFSGDSSRAATSSADLSAQPDSLAFGHVPLGGSRSREVTVRNRGDETARLLSVATTDATYVAHPDFSELAPGASGRVTVSFAPVEFREVSATLKLAFEAETVTVGLRGAGRYDPDLDGDRVLNDRDNCPAVPNPDQADADRDRLGDVCDRCPLDPLNDIDRDGLCGDVDNCPFAANADQVDRDADAVGDVCDNCGDRFNPDQADPDRDGLGSACDNCPLVANPDQEDSDSVGVFVEEPIDGRGPQDFRGLETVDVDGDGHLDIVTASSHTPGVAWRENQPEDRVFGPERPMVDEPVSAFTVADLNGDGWVDVAVKQPTSRSIAWFPRRADEPTFGDRRVVEEGVAVTSTGSIEAADLDGDGDLDLLVGGAGDHGVVWFENVDGRGAFGPRRPIVSETHQVRHASAADFDGDGDADVLVVRDFEDFVFGVVTWHENIDGHGTFSGIRYISEPRRGEAGTVEATAADIDGDRDLDVVAGPVSDDLVWFENLDGAGHFGGPRPVASWGRSREKVPAIVAADLDGDGDVDLVAASGKPGSSWYLEWYANTDGRGAFAQAVSLGTAPVAGIATSDIDADGDIDIVTSSGGAIDWFENRQNSGGFDRRKVAWLYWGWRFVVADLNGDRRPDLLARWYRDLLWYSDPSGGGDFVVRGEIPASDSVPRAIFALDADDDADLDVLELHADGLVVFENEDRLGTFGPARVVRGPEAWMGVAETVLADVDGDGDEDIVAGRFGSLSTSNGRVDVYLNPADRTSSWDLVSLGSTPGSPRALAAGDVDGDGDIDLIYGVETDRDSDVIELLENPGLPGAAWPRRILSAPRVGSTSVVLVDLDADGDPDLVSASPVPWQFEKYTIDCYENLGNGEFAAAVPISALSASWAAITTADLDGDGGTDLVLSSYNDDYDEAARIEWLPRLGGEIGFGPARLVRTGVTGFGELVPSDLDGDGRIDLVLLDKGTDQLLWLRNAIEGVGDACDVCPDRFDPDQFDADGDGVGDACDSCTDVDGDGFGDPGFPESTCAPDNCPRVANPSQADRDGLAFDPMPRTVLAHTSSVFLDSLADLDGDGDLDAIVRLKGVPQLAENVDGAGRFGAPRKLVNVYGLDTAVADLDGDGSLDLAVANSEGASWFANVDGAGSFDEPRSVPTGGRGTLVIEAIDLDGDSDLDLAMIARESLYVGGAYWHENLDGRGTFGEARRVGPASEYWPRLLPVDVDLDGDQDLLTLTSDRLVVWSENVDGRGTFGPHRAIADRVVDKFRIGDLDGDGDPDVVAASTDYGPPEPEEIVWYENLDGRGTFSEGRIVDGNADYGSCLGVLDLDEDGDVDLVASGVEWYENLDGRGTFATSAVLVEVGDDFAGNCDFGDIDRDGDVDLVTANSNYGRFDWYRSGDSVGDACDNCVRIYNPTQADRDRDGIGDFCDDCTDLDGDGFADPGFASASCPSDNCPFLPNPDQMDEDGDGTGTACDACPAGDDVDGDGPCDDRDNCPTVRNGLQTESDGDSVGDACDNCLALPNPDQADFDGYGWFGPARKTPMDERGEGPFVAADLDGDGDSDIVAMLEYPSGLETFVNVDGGGTFRSLGVTRWPFGYGTDLVAADLDDDGDLDILSSDHEVGRFVWHPNLDGAGTLGEGRLIDSVQYAKKLVPADVDGDGDLDLVALAGFGRRIDWYENEDGSGNFGEPQPISSPSGTDPSVYDCVVADLDADGRPDVAAMTYHWTVVWYRNVDGTGRFGAPLHIDPSPVGVLEIDAADFDGDRDVDLLLGGGGSLSNVLYWYENTGEGVFGSRTPIGASEKETRFAKLVDVDFDGRPDVLVSSKERGLGWYRNLHPSAAFGRRRDLPTELANRDLYVADLDGDGAVDLFGASYFAIDWYLNGAGDGVGDACDNCLRAPNSIQSDLDGDGLGDACDNCPLLPNPEQLDLDGDEIGDACDPCQGPPDPNAPDADGDGVPDSCDVCPAVADPSQSDLDGDGLGDACDNCPQVASLDTSDRDFDGVGDACDPCVDPDHDGAGSPGFPATTCSIDNCPEVSNWFQEDGDHDGVGDVCDNCPIVPNSTQSDPDADGVGDACDNCPAASNFDQRDSDGDRAGDACDPCTDLDGDGFADPGFDASTCPVDNCPALPNPDQADEDRDGRGDLCDGCPGWPDPGQEDSDGDGVNDACDRCPLVFDPDQPDADLDGVGDACDDCPDVSDPDQIDDDRDGVGDACDACVDTDFDGYGEPGRPGQVCPSDNCPVDWNGDQLDTDGDGVGDSCDNCAGASNPDQSDREPGLRFAPRRIVTSDLSGARAVTAADLDGDGRSDLVSAGFGVATVLWHRNLGAGRFHRGVVVSDQMVGAYDVTAADLDGDGDADVVAAAAFGSRVAWFANFGNGRFGTERPMPTPVSGPRSVVAADLDGDGDFDLAAVSFSTNSVLWFENTDGFGTFSDSISIASGVLGAHVVRAADLDGDGDVDLVTGGDSPAGLVQWFENLGDGSFGPPRPVSTNPTQTTALAPVDVDGDGALDLVVSEHANGAVVWYPNEDGLGTFGARTPISEAQSGAYGVAGADLDRDGDLDVVAAAFSNGTISWFENRDGLGSFGDPKIVTAEAYGVTGVRLQDLDGDGAVDVASASMFDASIGWSRSGSGDGIGDACDNCADAINPDQIDSDGDGVGDACDPSAGGDGPAAPDPSGRGREPAHLGMPSSP